jgi:alkylation response protein AidB-like acyl-CoA dehydrogenase
VIGLDDEHEALRRVARAFLVEQGVRSAARDALEGPETLPAFWSLLADVEWLGLHVPVDDGGSGYSVVELAVVLEELGYDCAPGPFLPCVAASATVAEYGRPAQRDALLPGLVSGTRTAAVCLHGSLAETDRRVTGDAGPGLCAGIADLLLFIVGDDVWIVDRDAPGIELVHDAELDPTRRAADVRCNGVERDGAHVLTGAASSLRLVVGVLMAAEIAGGLRACVDMATSYSMDRVAFGRRIGEFQAIKHHLANMAIDLELVTACAWDAVNALRDRHPRAECAVAVATTVAIAAFLRGAERNVQVHGGIGFTWEHDAHLFLKRAAAARALLGTPTASAARTTELLAAIGTDPMALPTSSDADELAACVRASAEEWVSWPADRRHEAIVDAGYLFPLLPAPWGIEANAFEQEVVRSELGALLDTGVLDPMTAWALPIVLPAIVEHGTAEQQERWIRPSMLGEITWCQLFSEPGAGSDLASLSTRATRVEGGWRVSGQKVWTSSAQLASLGLALVRTDFDAPRHHGLSCCVIDMRSTGVVTRPLRDLTGDADFNEVFLDDVFVPDKDVIGEFGEGWIVARSALGNERMSLGSRSVDHIFASGIPATVVADRALAAELGRILATRRAVELMHHRMLLRERKGAAPGAEASIAKLAAAENSQELAEFALGLLGPAALHSVGSTDAPGTVWLREQRETIAGGTSEILRNVIAERVLGLPRG